MCCFLPIFIIGQDTDAELLLKLEDQLKLDFDLQLNIKTKDDLCELPISQPNNAFEIDSVYKTFALIRGTKNMELLSRTEALENKYIVHIRSIWEKFYDFNDKSNNCPYLWDIYNIAFDFEITMMSLNCSKINDSKEIYKYFLNNRDYWYNIRYGKEGPPYLLNFKHAFFDKYANDAYATKNMFGIINPYIEKCENEITNELESMLNELIVNNVKSRYKCYLTKELWVNCKSEKIDKLLIKNADFLSNPHYSFNPLFEILPTRGKKYIPFLIDLCYNNEKYRVLEEYRMIQMYKYIFKSRRDKIDYPDRSKNEAPARQYLQKKIKSEAKKTHVLHKTSEILGGYYKDEKMLKVLLFINEYLDKDEDKQKLLVLLEPYKPLVKKYARTVRKMYKRTIKKLDKLSTNEE